MIYRQYYFQNNCGANPTVNGTVRWINSSGGPSAYWGFTTHTGSGTVNVTHSCGAAGWGTQAIGVINAYNGSAVVMTTGMMLTNIGNVGIGTQAPAYKLDVSGDIRITGTPYRASGDIAWQVPSDARLKDVVGPYSYGLAEILQLDMIKFKYKANNPIGADTSKEFSGVLAQQAERVIPESVHKDQRTGFLSLNTTPIFWAVVNAVKDLNKKIVGYDREIASVKEENARIKAQNEELQKQNELLRKDFEERLRRLEKK